MRRYLLVPATLLTLLFLAAPAELNARATSGSACDSHSGLLGPQETDALIYTMTNASIWYGTADYLAERYSNTSNTPTYSHYQDVSVEGTDHSYTNSIDVYRNTRIKRAGYSTISFQMSQWAIGNC